MSRFSKIKLKPLPHKTETKPTPSVSFKDLLNKFKKVAKSKENNQIFHFGGLTDMKNDSESSSNSDEEEKEKKLIDKRNLVKLLKSEKVNAKLKDYIYPNRYTNTNSLRKSNSTLQFSQVKFHETKYSDKGSFNMFFKKVHKITEFQRKGANNTLTPSFTFIKSSNENLIVPNPIGIVKKKGDPDIININHKRIPRHHRTSYCTLHINQIYRKMATRLHFGYTVWVGSGHHHFGFGA